MYLGGRHGACRQIPAHYIAVRDLLMDIGNLAQERERQVAASEVLLVCCQCVANVLLTCLERQVAASEVLLMCC
jgi:hypothetical protein